MKMHFHLILAGLLYAGLAYCQSAELASDAIVCTRTNVFVVKGKTLTDYASSQIPAWRFVHDGKKLVLEPWFSGGVTYSPHKIVECKTLTIATNEIARLKLTVTESQQESINRLAEEHAPSKVEEKPVVVVEDVK